MVNYLATPGSNATRYIKYYPGKKQLEIGFETGNVYRYSTVPQEIWEDYLKAAMDDQSGEFFNAHIRERYKFERIA
jgi:KTSC domain